MLWPGAGIMQAFWVGDIRYYVECTEVNAGLLGFEVQELMFATSYTVVFYTSPRWSLSLDPDHLSGISPVTTRLYDPIHESPKSMSAKHVV
jgi:hypothetical protein